MQDAVNTAWANGAIQIAAAGNIYTDDIHYPAGYENVISVGATDHQDNLSAFSNHGVAASLLAPGTHIVSTVPGGFCGQLPGEQSDCYDTQSGTSMAAPHVAGLAALMFAAYPTASNDEIRAVLRSSADTTGALGQNMLAWSTYGRINMQTALATDPTGSGNQDPSSVGVSGAPLLSTVNVGRGSKRGRAVVTIVDDLGNPIADSTVTGEFGIPFSESIDAVSDSQGLVEFLTSDSVKGGLSFEFCVTSIQNNLPFIPSQEDCATF